MLFTSGFGALSEVRELVQGLQAAAAADVEQALTRIEEAGQLRIPAKSALAMQGSEGFCTWLIRTFATARPGATKRLKRSR
jgi:hypothetical protein